MLQRKHSAILLTFFQLPVVIKIFVLSIFEWPFYTGFTQVVLYFNCYLYIIYYQSFKTTNSIGYRFWKKAGFVPIYLRQTPVSRNFSVVST